MVPDQLCPMHLLRVLRGGVSYSGHSINPDFETSRRDILKLVYEKEDLLVNHGGKNNEYNFYRHAGVTMVGDKGTHINEEKPVNLKSNLP